MAKVCPKCNKLNLDSARFCANCGEDLAEVTKKPSKSGGMGEWWSKQGSGAKSGVLIVGICCIGLIAIIGIAGMASPDATTSLSSQSDSASSSRSTCPICGQEGIYSSETDVYVCLDCGVNWCIDDDGENKLYSYYEDYVDDNDITADELYVMPLEG